jgi:hypothetical protein
MTIGGGGLDCFIIGRSSPCAYAFNLRLAAKYWCLASLSDDSFSGFIIS